MSFTSNRSASLIELYTGDVLLHVNQVSSQTKIARPAFCRDQHIKPFHAYIDLWNETDYKDVVDTKPKYFQLNHGYQSLEPNFISLGIPGTNNKWVDQIPLLEEFTVLEGRYPKSKPEAIQDFSLEEFQQFAEEGENIGHKESNS